MGCDIHLFREVKRNGQWETIEESYEDEEETCLQKVRIMRNYWLFGLLCNGVRTKWSFAFERRGLPDDVSGPVQDNSDDWDIDGHSHSWLTLEELKHKAAELTILPNTDSNQLAPHLAAFINLLKWPEGISPADCRVVFWFDN